jgi:hypothetical protein
MAAWIICIRFRHVLCGPYLDGGNGGYPTCSGFGLIPVTVDDRRGSTLLGLVANQHTVIVSL